MKNNKHRAESEQHRAAAAKPQRDPDPAPGAKPDLKTLQELIRRRFNGFPVPLALPWGS